MKMMMTPLRHVFLVCFLAGASCLLANTSPAAAETYSGAMYCSAGKSYAAEIDIRRSGKDVRGTATIAGVNDGKPVELTGKQVNSERISLRASTGETFVLYVTPDGARANVKVRGSKLLRGGDLSLE